MEISNLGFDPSRNWGKQKYSRNCFLLVRTLLDFFFFSIAELRMFFILDTYMVAFHHKVTLNCFLLIWVQTQGLPSLFSTNGYVL